MSCLFIGLICYGLSTVCGPGILWFSLWVSLSYHIYRLVRRRYTWILVTSSCASVCERVSGTLLAESLSPDQVRNSLFFPPYVNAFYMRSEIPSLVCRLDSDHSRTHFSVLSSGEWYHSVVDTVSPVRGLFRLGRVTAEGVFFHCEVPWRFSCLRLFLPCRWGKHMRFPLLEYFWSPLVSPPVKLIGQLSRDCWCYGTPAEDPHDAFWYGCYCRLHRYPGSFFSIMGHSVYIFVPFSFGFCHRDLERCMMDLMAIIDLIHNMVLYEISTQVLQAM